MPAHDASGHCPTRPPSCTPVFCGAIVSSGNTGMRWHRMFPPSSLPFSRRQRKPRQTQPSVSVSAHAKQQDPCFPGESTWHTVNRVAGSGIHPHTTGQCHFARPDGEVFLYNRLISGSDCAITGRGLRRRNPKTPNNRWHCLTPRTTPCFFDR